MQIILISQNAYIGIDKRIYWSLQNILIFTKDGPPNWAGQTDRQWPTPWRWSLMQPGAAFVIHIQSLNSAPIHNGHWAVHLFTMGTGQCIYTQWTDSASALWTTLAQCSPSVWRTTLQSAQGQHTQFTSSKRRWGRIGSPVQDRVTTSLHKCNTVTGECFRAECSPLAKGWRLWTSTFARGQCSTEIFILWLHGCLWTPQEPPL